MSSNHTHIQVMVFQPGAEAREKLGSVPIVLSCYITLSSSLPVSYRHFLHLPLPSSTSLPELCSLPASITRSSGLPSLRLRSMSSCPHHRRDTRVPDRRSTVRHSSSMGRVKIYWATLFWWQKIYVSASSIPNSAISASRGGYYHCPTMSHIGYIPARRRAILWWNPPRVLPTLGVIAQVYEPNKMVSWTTTL